MKVYIVIYNSIYRTSILKVFSSYSSVMDFVSLKAIEGCSCEIEEHELEV